MSKKSHTNNSRSFDKIAPHKKALDLLGKQDDDLLRYACLELRFCIEAITYNKLLIYSKYLPPSLLKTWQPPQAFKALIQLEPTAGKDFNLSIARESSPGVPSGPFTHLGEHKTLSIKWLSKHYNKLGNYLHTHFPFGSKKPVSPAEIRTALEKIADELKPIVESTLDGRMANVVTFDCVACKKTISVNEEGLIDKKEIECFNPKCGAMFWVSQEDDRNFTFMLQVTLFKCLKCGKGIRVENHLIATGCRLKCEKCSAVHEIRERRWYYEIIKGT